MNELVERYSALVGSHRYVYVVTGHAMRHAEAAQIAAQFESSMKRYGQESIQQAVDTVNYEEDRQRDGRRADFKTGLRRQWWDR